jgi:DNA sulfur modification protein DndB
VKIFTFDEKLISDEMKTQSTPDVAKLSDDARYVIGNPIHQALAPITAFIDGDLIYEPIDETTGHQDIGKLTVSADVALIAPEGQRRLCAIELALQDRPELEESYIPVILYQKTHRKRLEQVDLLSTHIISAQQNFSDRDRPRIIAKAVMARVKVFQNLTDTERSSLPMRSQKLFTLSAIENATQALLTEHEDYELKDQIQLAIHYWNIVYANIPDWNKVLQGKISSGIIRRDYVHSHAVTLAALGHLGASLISIYPRRWQAQLKNLEKIDWSRKNPEWQHRIIDKGRISKSRNSVILMTIYFKKILGLPLAPDEEHLEITSFSKNKILPNA